MAQPPLDEQTEDARARAYYLEQILDSCIVNGESDDGQSAGLLMVALAIQALAAEIRASLLELRHERISP